MQSWDLTSLIRQCAVHQEIGVYICPRLMDPHNPPSHHAHKPSRSPHTGIALELCVWVCVWVPWCRPAGGFCFDLRAAGVAHGRGYVRGHIQGEKRPWAPWVPRRCSRLCVCRCLYEYQATAGNAGALVSRECTCLIKRKSRNMAPGQGHPA